MPTNANTDLLTRLLELYPIKVIKDYFNIKGTFAKISESIIAGYTSGVIFKFATENSNFTRQHVHIFNLRPKFTAKTLNLTDFPYKLINSAYVNGEFIVDCLPLVKFDVMAVPPYEEASIKFHLPVKIRILNNHVIVQMTMLEKNLSRYFSEDGVRKKVVNSERSVSEDDIIQELSDFLNNRHMTISRCDIHKGIKKMLTDDVIDLSYVKDKKARSTDTITMDEDFTVKETYPDAFEKIMKNPLIKSLLIYKIKDDRLCKQFTVEADSGKIAISSFQENITQIENLTNEIIGNN